MRSRHRTVAGPNTKGDMGGGTISRASRCSRQDPTQHDMKPQRISSDQGLHPRAALGLSFEAKVPVLIHPSIEKSLLGMCRDKPKRKILLIGHSVNISWTATSPSWKHDNCRATSPASTVNQIPIAGIVDPRLSKLPRRTVLETKNMNLRAYFTGISRF